MLPYPDLSSLPDDVARAVVRLVRLVNQMRLRHPDLDRFALSVENETDLRAAVIVCRLVEQQCRDFELMLSPWDGRQLLETLGTQEREGREETIRRRPSPSPKQGG